MYIPDLFGAYTKGRQQAVQDNWNDLKNYEDVEAARNRNDRDALQLLQDRIRFGGEQQKWAYGIDGAARQNELDTLTHKGNVANASMNSDYATIRYGSYQAYRPELIQATGDLFGANVGRLQNTANAAKGYVDYMRAGNKDYAMGQSSAQDAVNIAKGNSIIHANAPTAATQQVAQSNATYGTNMQGLQLLSKQQQSAIENQPEQAKLTATNTQNMLYDAQNYITERERIRQQGLQQPPLTNREIASYINLYTSGTPEDKARAAYLLQSGGQDLAKLGLVQPTTTTPTTGANGVPQYPRGVGVGVLNQETLAGQNWNNQPMSVNLFNHYLQGGNGGAVATGTPTVWGK